LVRNFGADKLVRQWMAGDDHTVAICHGQGFFRIERSFVDEPVEPLDVEAGDDQTAHPAGFVMQRVGERDLGGAACQAFLVGSDKEAPMLHHLLEVGTIADADGLFRHLLPASQRSLAVYNRQRIELRHGRHDIP
jgi:hypothetical protein